MHIRLDALGGIAGDMFIGAVLDARPDLSQGTLDAIRATGIPQTWRLSLADHHDHVLRGKRFSVIEPHGSADPRADHTSYANIVERLREAPLADGVRRRAQAIFELLAKAEASVHGVAIDDVTFHEVGAWDSVADIVGAAFLLESLKPDSWSVSALPIGGGRVSTAHGAMPVPAPATALLLQDFALFDDGIAGERVTPTGAAILRHLWLELGPPGQPQDEPMRLAGSGTGFGARALPGISNVLRMLAFETAPAARTDDRVGVIEFEVDDQTAEDLAAGVETLRLQEGVLDVLQWPAYGKKSRIVFHLQILCRPEALQRVIDACFVETTTIGLRWTVSARAKLERRMDEAQLGDQAVAVKVVKRPDGTRSAKADIGSLDAPGGHADRRRKRSSAEAAALAQTPPDDSGESS